MLTLLLLPVCVARGGCGGTAVDAHRQLLRCRRCRGVKHAPCRRYIWTGVLSANVGRRRCAGVGGRGRVRGAARAQVASDGGNGRCRGGGHGGCVCRRPRVERRPDIARRAHCVSGCPSSAVVCALCGEGEPCWRVVVLSAARRNHRRFCVLCLAWMTANNACGGAHWCPYCSRVVWGLM